MTKLNVLHGIFIGMVITTISLHLNVYLWNYDYKVLATQYYFIGAFSYIIYWLYPSIKKGMNIAILKKSGVTKWQTK